jgi:hypothetical protein
MAKRVQEVITGLDLESAASELVDSIAALPAADNEKPRKRTSFAAKFCHFFVDAERFPIYDDAARKAIKLHLGNTYINNKTYPYEGFCKNFSRLKAEAGLNCTTRELDRYLWLTGMYMRWLKNRSKKRQLVNVELRELFNNPNPETTAELDALLPSILDRAFKGEL